MGPRCYTISSSKTWSQLFLVFFLCHPWDQIHSNIESSPGWKKMVVDSYFTPRHDNTHQKKKRPCQALPCWFSDEEFAFQCRGYRVDPWCGKTPHALEQLSPCTITTDPTCLEPVLHNERSHFSEECEHHNKSPPLGTPRESPCRATKTQCN